MADFKFSNNLPDYTHDYSENNQKKTKKSNKITKQKIVKFQAKILKNDIDFPTKFPDYRQEIKEKNKKELEKQRKLHSQKDQQKTGNQQGPNNPNNPQDVPREEQKDDYLKKAEYQTGLDDGQFKKQYNIEASNQQLQKKHFYDISISDEDEQWQQQRNNFDDDDLRHYDQGLNQIREKYNIKHESNQKLLDQELQNKDTKKKDIIDKMKQSGIYDIEKDIDKEIDKNKKKGIIHSAVPTNKKYKETYTYIYKQVNNDMHKSNVQIYKNDTKLFKSLVNEDHLKNIENKGIDNLLKEQLAKRKELINNLENYRLEDQKKIRQLEKDYEQKNLELIKQIDINKFQLADNKLKEMEIQDLTQREKELQNRINQYDKIIKDKQEKILKLEDQIKDTDKFTKYEIYDLEQQLQIQRQQLDFFEKQQFQLTQSQIKFHNTITAKKQMTQSENKEQNNIESPSIKSFNSENKEQFQNEPKLGSRQNTNKSYGRQGSRSKKKYIFKNPNNLQMDPDIKKQKLEEHEKQILENNKKLQNNEPQEKKSELSESTKQEIKKLEQLKQQLIKDFNIDEMKQEGIDDIIKMGHKDQIMDEYDLMYSKYYGKKQEDENKNLEQSEDIDIKQNNNNEEYQKFQQQQKIQEQTKELLSYHDQYKYDLWDRQDKESYKKYVQNEDPENIEEIDRFISDIIKVKYGNKKKKNQEDDDIPPDDKNSSSSSDDNNDDDDQQGPNQGGNNPFKNINIQAPQQQQEQQDDQKSQQQDNQASDKNQKQENIQQVEQIQQEIKENNLMTELQQKNLQIKIKQLKLHANNDEKFNIQLEKIKLFIEENTNKVHSQNTNQVQQEESLIHDSQLLSEHFNYDQDYDMDDQGLASNSNEPSILQFSSIEQSVKQNDILFESILKKSDNSYEKQLLNEIYDISLKLSELSIDNKNEKVINEIAKVNKSIQYSFNNLEDDQIKFPAKIEKVDMENSMDQLRRQLRNLDYEQLLKNLDKMSYKEFFHNFIEIKQENENIQCQYLNLVNSYNMKQILHQNDLMNKDLEIDLLKFNQWALNHNLIDKEKQNKQILNGNIYLQKKLMNKNQELLNEQYKDQGEIFQLKQQIEKQNKQLKNLNQLPQAEQQAKLQKIADDLMSYEQQKEKKIINDVEVILTQSLIFGQHQINDVNKVHVKPQKRIVTDKQIKDIQERILPKRREGLKKLKQQYDIEQKLYNLQNPLYPQQNYQQIPQQPRAYGANQYRANRNVSPNQQRHSPNNFQRPRNNYQRNSPNHQRPPIYPQQQNRGYQIPQAMQNYYQNFNRYNNNYYNPY